jgi:hypothetical protein
VALFRLAGDGRDDTAVGPTVGFGFDDVVAGIKSEYWRNGLVGSCALNTISGIPYTRAIRRHTLIREFYDGLS